MMTLPAQPAHRLGAIELIELGNSRSSAPTMRRPFLSGRRMFTGGVPEQSPQLAQLQNPFQLGQLDWIAGLGSFLSGMFASLFNGLSDMINPLIDALSQGVGYIFDGVAGLLANIPIVGVFASQLVLVGKAVIQWGLSVPGMLLDGAGFVFEEIKGAIDAVMTDDEKKEAEGEAKKKILDKADEMGGKDFKDSVQNVLNGKGPDGEEDPPNKPPDNSEDVGKEDTDPGIGANVKDVLKIGLPIAGAATLVLFALS